MLELERNLYCSNCGSEIDVEIDRFVIIGDDIYCGDCINDCSDCSEIIEKMIDRLSIEKFIETVIDICYCKSEHIGNYWQDKELARYWAKLAKKLEKVLS